MSVVVMMVVVMAGCGERRSSKDQKQKNTCKKLFHPHTLARFANAESGARIGLWYGSR
jgi:hypothetical protein